MLVGHSFDFALILRSRRRELRLRQEDLAKKAGVSRGFIVDLEHGKETVELGKVLTILRVMNVPLSLGWREEPPDWTRPIIKRAIARERRCADARPRNWRQKRRPDPKAPKSWFDRGGEFEVRRENQALAAEREAEARLWTKQEAEKFVARLSAQRTRIVRAIARRAGLPLLRQ